MTKNLNTSTLVLLIRSSQSSTGVASKLFSACQDWAAHESRYKCWTRTEVQVLLEYSCAGVLLVLYAEKRSQNRVQYHCCVYTFDHSIRNGYHDDGLPAPGSANESFSVPRIACSSCTCFPISVAHTGRGESLGSQSAPASGRHITIRLCRLVYIGSTTTPELSFYPSMACITSCCFLLGKKPSFRGSKKGHDYV